MTKTKLLLVEDDLSISNMLKEYLERNGFAVIAAYDGESGLRLFNSERPDLVLLDVQLPKIIGTEVCRIIRKTSGVPIIMATALAEDIDKIVGLEIGADDYLTKPFHPRELLARVRNLLKRCYGNEVAAIDAHVGRIRKKLAEFDSKTEFLETVRGFGFKIIPDGVAKND